MAGIAVDGNDSGMHICNAIVDSHNLLIDAYSLVTDLRTPVDRQADVVASYVLAVAVRLLAQQCGRGL